jgi:hypothetical protein
MVSVNLVFDLLGFWHAGTGACAGVDLDATVFRTPAGLPCLPGRTVKGLVRAAMEQAEAAGAIATGRTRHWIGTPAQKGAATAEREQRLEAMRFSTAPGRLRFESAVLVDEHGDRAAWEAFAQSPRGKPLVRHLFRSFSSTALEGGIAKAQTLRSIEVVVPLTLVSTVSSEETDKRWIDDLEESTLFLDAVGSLRSRGLGRARVQVVR